MKNRELYPPFSHYLAFLGHFLLGFCLCECSSLKAAPQTIHKHLKAIELTAPSSGIEPIDCIYVINLEARRDRWDWMASLCQKHFLFSNRVNAIDGWALPQEVQKELTHPYPCRLRGGQFGCLLSHISILKDAYKRGFDLIWVMEDDIEFVEDPRQLPSLLADLSNWDPDWDVFYTDPDFRDDSNGYVRSLGSDFRPEQQEKSIAYYTERIVINSDLMQIRSRFGTYSMLISKKGVRKILHHFTSCPIWTSIDIDLHYIPSIREYAARRDIVSNLRHSSSDTEENRGGAIATVDSST